MKSISEYDLIVLDTSIILSLYEYSYSCTSDILLVLNQNIEKIWIPHQVYKEFKSQDEQNFKEKAISNYKTLTSDLNKVADEFNQKFNKIVSGYKKRNFSLSNEFENEVLKKITDIKSDISKNKKDLQKEEAQNRDLHNKNIVSNFLESLKEISNIGSGYSPNELLKIYEEGEKRYKYKIPPGYKDDKLHNIKNGKESPEKFGDLLVWKQILDRVESDCLNILFVTNDNKEDWKKDSLLREELEIEFLEYSPNSSIKVVSLEKFINVIGKEKLSLETRIEIRVKEVVEELVIEDGILNEKIYSMLENQFYEKNLIEEKVKKVKKVKIDIIEGEVLGIEDLTIDKDSVNSNIEEEIIAVRFDTFLSAKIKINSFIEMLVEEKIECEIEIIKKELKNSEEGIEIPKDSLQIEFIKIEIFSIDFENDFEVCYRCNQNEGEYGIESGELVCRFCSQDMECCTSCGTLLEPENDNFYGNKCEKCHSREN